MDATNYIQSSNCTIYPGEYFPMIKSDELMNELKKPHEGKVLHPFINVSECRNYYKIEAAIPGVKREDFCISIDENVLSISALHKRINVGEPEKFRLHEFNYECFNRNVIIPGNVEMEFVKAEYKEGILSVFFPKTNSPGSPHHINVIVY